MQECVHRYAGVIETSTKDFLHRINHFRNDVQHSIREDGDAKLKHDFLMLRLFETFSESAPQLTLMMSIMLQRRELDHIIGLFQIQSTYFFSDHNSYVSLNPLNPSIDRLCESLVYSLNQFIPNIELWHYCVAQNL